ncbi:MAG: hypothetical protein NC399_02810 [Muribaculum sp.]|nr:hypothetical protein [Muribaculum sp.]
MTEQEAKEYLEDMITEGQIQYGDQITSRDDEEMLKAAISALEEIQKYREIGTVEECRAAMEQQRTRHIDCIDCAFKNYCETRKADRMVCGCMTGKPLKRRDSAPAAGVEEETI